MVEKTFLEQLKQWFRSQKYRLRIWWDPDPSEGERHNMMAKTLGRLEEKRQDAKWKTQGGVDGGWSDERMNSFGRTPYPAALGRGESTLGIEYHNLSATEVSV